METSYERALRAVYAVCYMQMKLGYFVNLTKSHLQPSTRMIHLGLGICSKTMSFWIPEKKKVSFAEVREGILLDGTVLLKTMQRFIGKCQSFALVFPAASLYTRECCSFVRQLDDVNPTALTVPVREEIRFWRFVDSLSEPIPWRQERHLTLHLNSDASGHRWGGVLVQPTGDVTFGDYWAPEVRGSTDMCYKEALALYFVLLSVIDRLWNRRVTVEVDSQGLYHAWTGLRARSLALARVLKLIFALTLEANFALRLEWVSSDNNIADAPSREISFADSRLPTSLWAFLQKELAGYKGFTFDLMALPSNVPKGYDGQPLRFFSRYPVPGSAGVNVFAQECPRGEQLYAFPPFVLIPALIRLFCEWGNIVVLMVVPKHPQPRSWWPKLLSFALQSVRLAERGQVGALEYPSTCGYVKSTRGLPFELWGLKCFFPAGSGRDVDPPRPRSVLLVADSMFRGLQEFGWPSSLAVTVRVEGGAKMDVLCRSLTSCCRTRVPSVAVLHGGINNFSRLDPCTPGVTELLKVFEIASKRLKAEYPGCEFIMSSVCPTRLDSVNRSVAVANTGLRQRCEAAGWHFFVQ